MLIQERNHILVYKVLRYSHSHSILKITKELIQEISHFSVNNVPRHFLLQLTLRLTKELIQDRDHIIVKIVPKYFLKRFTVSVVFNFKAYYGLKFPAQILTASKSFERKLLTTGSKCRRKHRKHLRIYDDMGSPGCNVSCF